MKPNVIRNAIASFTALAISFLSISAAEFPREKILLNNGWKFSLGHAGDMVKDFSHGTEYFTYFAKTASNNDSKSPAAPGFDDSSWQAVSLPHDWVVDLPFDAGASHSHGYKCIGWKYPEYSVGWYRKNVFIPEEDKGRRIMIEFEGIFRDSEVFCNGIYMGHERSGYASSIYDMTEYLDYGKDNIITVRVDASVEEGWFYEGAGIYRNVYLHKTSDTSIAPYGVMLKEYRFNPDRSSCTIVSEVSLDPLNKNKEVLLVQSLMDAEGQSVGTVFADSRSDEMALDVDSPLLWSVESPYLYTLRTCVYDGEIGIENLLDVVDVRIGIRSIDFDPQKGFLLNGYNVKLKGCDLHLDHAGVGTAVPDELWRYKLEELKKYGFNAIRSSHNPASPAMLDLCDEMGFLVIDENRLMGINNEHFDLMERMIRRDANHPSVIMWSIGNEEWAVEYSRKGFDIAERMCDFVHSIDASRPVTYGNCSGNEMPPAFDIFGYNYVVQNAIEKYHVSYLERMVVGTEETTGTGTRGKYATDKEHGWMLSLNRSGVDRDPLNGSDDGMQFSQDGKVLNVIERGWKYAASRPWNAGLFYWTGFDYRGEPNPMSWPATGSQFGILDYCGFPKDEAFYLKSCWTDEPMVYAAPQWGGNMREGENVDLWIYSNCDEVQLLLNGSSLGKQPMPRNGHISWPVKYRSGRIEAVGIIRGKKVARYLMETAGLPFKLSLTASKTRMKADGQDVIVVDITVLDDKGRPVLDAELPLAVNASNVSILGWGNGDPSFKVVERPLPGSGGTFSIQTFSGKAQLLLRSVGGASGTARVDFIGLNNDGLTINY